MDKDKSGEKKSGSCAPFRWHRAPPSDRQPAQDEDLSQERPPSLRRARRRHDQPGDLFAGATVCGDEAERVRCGGWARRGCRQGVGSREEAGGSTSLSAIWNKSWNLKRVDPLIISHLKFGTDQTSVKRFEIEKLKTERKGVLDPRPILFNKKSDMMTKMNPNVFFW